MHELSDDQDAFGYLLQDHQRGITGAEVVERDDGFVGTAGSAALYFASFKAWPPHEQAAMIWVRGRVLDIGCGAGRHALHLQGRGLAVTGIDLSPKAVAVCRERGLADARILGIEHVHTLTETWDTVLLLGANFGLVGSAAGARELFARLAGITSPRARLIAESRDPAATADPRHTAYQEANRQRGRLPGQITMRIRYQHRTNPWFDYLFVAKAELESLLAGTGWGATRYLDATNEPGAYIALIEKTG